MTVAEEMLELATPLAITDEMVLAGARVGNPIAFEKNHDGEYLLPDSARQATIEEVREVLTAVLALTPVAAPQGREALALLNGLCSDPDENGLVTFKLHIDVVKRIQALAPAVAPDGDENSSDVAMDLTETKDSLVTAQWYIGQLEAVINQVCAKLGVEPKELIQGNAIELIPALAQAQQRGAP